MYMYPLHVLQIQDKETPVSEDKPQSYKSLYTYTSDQPGDLSFEAGEVIQVTNAQRDWWIGSIGERIGTFPANFVIKVEDEVSLKNTVKPVLSDYIKPDIPGFQPGGCLLLYENSAESDFHVT